MPVCEKQAPAVAWASGGKGIHSGAVASVEREMVEPRIMAVVAVADQCGRPFHDNVRLHPSPTATRRPILELLVAKLGEQPPPLCNRPRQVGYPKLDVM